MLKAGIERDPFFEDHRYNELADLIDQPLIKKPGDYLAATDNIDIAF